MSGGAGRIIGAAVGYLTIVEGEMTSGRWFAIFVLALVYIVAAIDAARGQSRQSPPCQEACPAGLACALYIGLIKEGKNRESIEMVKSLCPFPGAIGRPDRIHKVRVFD